MSVQPTSQIGTYLLTSGSVTISEEMGIRTMALKLVSGTVTYTGSLTTNGLTSTALTLDSNGYAVSTINPIDGFTINASAGSVIINLAQ